jgi:hypothetical protein
MFELANLANFSLQASLQTLPTFAVGRGRTTNKPFALPPPPCFATFVSPELGQLFVQRQESANNSHVGHTITSCWYLCVLAFLAGSTLKAKTASYQPSQQGKEGLDKGVSTNSRVMLSNCVCHWMHQGGGGVTLRKGKSHIGDFVLVTNLSMFFLGHFYFCVVSHKNLCFLAGNEYLGVKKSQFLP